MLYLTSLALSLLPFAQESTPVQHDQAALEADFAELLSGCKLVGFYTANDMPDVQEDSYTITKVSKQDDGRWLFEAVIEFGGREVPFKIPLVVEWAGDTPMISVTDLGIPMLGTYTSRILFHGDQYAGLWSGSEHGGHMWGRIERLDQQAPEAEESADENHLWRNDGSDGNWPSFRGWHGGGVSEGFPTPTEWSVEDGTNINWRVEVPGMTHSSPVIWGDQLFITAAVRADGEQSLQVGLYGDIAPVEDESEFGFLLLCYDKNTGELLWEQEAWAGVPAIKRHTKASHASSSPATDGKRVAAFFGSEGLYCYDMEGELLWEKHFEDFDSGYYVVPSAQWGFSSSPVIHDDLVIVQCDLLGDSFIAAYSADTGEEVWLTPRDEVPTWSTPTIDVRAGRSQVICNGWDHIGGYDLATGKGLWKMKNRVGGDIPVPTPIVGNDLIYITNGHGGPNPIYAISAMAEGELSADASTEAHLAWGMQRGGTYMQTPLVYGEELYACNDAGIAGCFDATSGENIYRERVGHGRTGFTSSPVAADGKLYFASEEGDVFVVRAGRDFEILAENPLGEETMASPAISEGVLYYRTRNHLVAVGETAE